MTAIFNCRTCGGTWEADIDTSKITAASLQRFADAQHAHITAHPDQLKTPMVPDPIYRHTRQYGGAR